MKSEYLNLPDDFIEILHNPSIKNKSYLIRLTNFGNERYYLTLNRDNMMVLAEFILKYLENNS